RHPQRPQTPEAEDVRHHEHEKAVPRAERDDAFDHRTTTVVCSDAIFCPSRVTATVTCHCPLPSTLAGPRYVPGAARGSANCWRIAGMLIDGIAGMNRITLTSASSTGAPAGVLTVTSKVFSPERGGSGIEWNVTPSALPGAAGVAPPDAGVPSNACSAPRSWLSESIRKTALVATRSPDRRPLNTSTSPFARVPALISRGSK